MNILKEKDINIGDVVKVTTDEDVYIGEVTYLSASDKSIEVSNREYSYELSIGTEYIIDIVKVNRTVETW